MLLAGEAVVEFQRVQAPHNLSVAVLAHGWYSVCCAREGCALSPLELRARWGTGAVRILILLDVRVVWVWVERALGKPPAKPSRLTSTGISCHKEFLNPAALCAAKKKVGQVPPARRLAIFFFFF